MPTALVTGSAGFIGFHCCARLLREGWRVIGLDALTDYYDVDLKHARHSRLAPLGDFVPEIGRVEDPGRMAALFERETPDVVIHLAAQAGVRYSIENPRSYLESNIIGTFEILEAARAFPPRHLLLASTSSAYGANTRMPYQETDRADHQMSFYAATKKSTESMAHSYAHLWHIPTTMFRFFTVYGTYGRPDLALFKFVRAALAGEAIDIYNHGQMARDFTYVGDLVKAIRLLIDAVPPRPDARDVPIPNDSLSPVAPFRSVNIGNGASVPLMEFITELEKVLGQEIGKNMMEMQKGDVPATWANTDLLEALTGYRPNTPISEGIRDFVAWYRDHYRV